MEIFHHHAICNIIHQNTSVRGTADVRVLDQHLSASVCERKWAKVAKRRQIYEQHEN